MKCNRCGRHHSGVCGIPPGRRARPVAQTDPALPGRSPPHATRGHRFLLERLLLAALTERRRLTPGLATADDAALEGYDRLETYIQQLRVQIGER